jgi:hypothetical protein
LCCSSSRKKVEIYFSWCNKKHCRRRRILEAACLLKGGSDQPLLRRRGDLIFRVLLELYITYMYILS